MAIYVNNIYEYVVHICPLPICCHIFLTNMLSYISKCISAYILKYYKIGRFKYVKIYVAHIWQLIWPIYLTTIYARIWDSNTFLSIWNGNIFLSICMFLVCPNKWFPYIMTSMCTYISTYISKCIPTYILK